MSDGTVSEVRTFLKNTKIGTLPETHDEVGNSAYFYPSPDSVLELRDQTLAKFPGDLVKCAECDRLFFGLAHLIGAAQVKFQKAREALAAGDERELKVQLEWAWEDLQVAELRAQRIEKAYYK